MAKLLHCLADRLFLNAQLPLPPAPQEWTATDATHLQAFLQTPPGKKLSERLRFLVCEVAINGARLATHAEHRAGISAGWDEAVRYLHSLSRVSRVEDTNPDKTPPGETELLEQLSP